MRIAGEILFRKKIMPEPFAVVVAEPVAPIIAVSTILCLTGLGLECFSVGTKTKIAAIDVHGLALFLSVGNRADFAAAVPICAVKPIIQAIIESVHAVLLVAFS